MENYKNESMVDVAYSVLKEMDDKISFSELYSKVAELIGLSDEEKANRISKFYTNLSLDGRFNALKNSEWNLKERCAYDAKDDFNLFYDDMEKEEKANKEKEDVEEENEANGTSEDSEIDEGEEASADLD